MLSILLSYQIYSLVSVTEMVFANGKKMKGLCSSYLQGLSPNATSQNSSACRIFVRPSSFRLPKQLSCPIIMIGNIVSATILLVFHLYFL